jgi:L-aspartate semialdehyde sulfurtransferase ferredoxin
MSSQRIVIKYPPRLVDKPILCHLTKEYDLDFNVLRAQVAPDTGGLMVLEISGPPQKQKAALKRLHEQGVSTQRLSQDVVWDDGRCAQCGLCVSLCPSGALGSDPDTQRVSFQHEKCVACEYCIQVCPVQAMQIRF